MQGSNPMYSEQKISSITYIIKQRTKKHIYAKLSKFSNNPEQWRVYIMSYTHIVLDQLPIYPNLDVAREQARTALKLYRKSTSYG